MLEAIQSFTIRYGDEIVQVIKGQTRLAEGHEIAKANPRAFRPVVGSGSGGRDRVYASGLGEELTATVPSDSAYQQPVAGSRAADIDVAALWRKRGGPRPKPPRYRLGSRTQTRLSDSPSKYAVRLAPTARQDLISDLRATTISDNREVGAAIFGPRPVSWATVVEVTRIGTAGDALRWPRAIARDHAHDARQAQEIRRQTDGQACEIGYWHSHPATDSTLSRTDLTHSSQMKALLGIPTFVSIVATPDPVRGWDRPELTCWVVRCVGSGHDVAEPAELL